VSKRTLSLSRQVLHAESGWMEKVFCTLEYSVPRRSLPAHRACTSPSDLFPGLQLNATLNGAAGWKSISAVSQQTRRWIDTRIALPFPCMSSVHECNSRMEVSPLWEQEFDMLNLDFVKKRLWGSSNTEFQDLQIRILGHLGSKRCNWNVSVYSPGRLQYIKTSECSDFKYLLSHFLII